MFANDTAAISNDNAIKSARFNDLLKEATTLIFDMLTMRGRINSLLRRHNCKQKIGITYMSAKAEKVPIIGKRGENNLWTKNIDTQQTRIAASILIFERYILLYDNK
jgi:hypothetical protein